MILRPDDPTVRSSKEHDGAGESGPSEWSLTVRHCPDGALVGRRFVVGDRVGLGRVSGPDVEAAIDDVKLSRRHAVVAVEDGRVRIRDQGSTNGTHVNGQQVTERPL